MLGSDGIFNNAKTASEEYNKQEATETMNLKITNVQISKYAEKQRMPTLKELADNFCEDDDFQYVQETSEVANLTKISNENPTSIYTKLKAYPYEFEINSSLQLASIDGVKITNTNTTNLKAEIIEELKSYIDSKINFASPTFIYKCSAEYKSDIVTAGTHYINETDIFSSEISNDNFNTVSSRDSNGYLNIKESGLYVINTYGSTGGVLALTSGFDIFDSEKNYLLSINTFVDYTHTTTYYNNTMGSVTVYLEKGQFIKPYFRLENKTKDKSFYASVCIYKCF